MPTHEDLLARYGDEIRQAREARERGWGRRGVAKRYGLTERQARRLVETIDPDGLYQPKPKPKPSRPKRPKVTVEHHAEGHATASGGVRTLDDLLEAAGVDQKAWRVASWQARAWDAAIGDGLVRTMHYVRAALERRRTDLVTPVVHPAPIRDWAPR